VPAWTIPWPSVAAAPVLGYASVQQTQTTNITLQAGIVQGQILILFDYASGSGDPSPVTPSGWTMVVNMGGANRRLTMLYKVADGTESGTTLILMSGGVEVEKKCLVISTGKLSPTVSASTPVEQVTDGDPASQLIAASGAAQSAILLACACSTGVSTPVISPSSTFTELYTSRDWIRMYYLLQSSPADVTVDVNDCGLDNKFGSFYLSVS